MLRRFVLLEVVICLMFPQPAAVRCSISRAAKFVLFSGLTDPESIVILASVMCSRPFRTHALMLSATNPYGSQNTRPICDTASIITSGSPQGMMRKAAYPSNTSFVGLDSVSGARLQLHRAYHRRHAQAVLPMAPLKTGFWRPCQRGITKDDHSLQRLPTPPQYLRRER